MIDNLITCFAAWWGRVMPSNPPRICPKAQMSRTPLIRIPSRMRIFRHDSDQQFAFMLGKKNTTHHITSHRSTWVLPATRVAGYFEERERSIDWIHMRRISSGLGHQNSQGVPPSSLTHSPQTGEHSDCNPTPGLVPGTICSG